MKQELPQKFKILIGIVAFVIIMAAIVWIVALALLATDIKTEVYAAEFDYVDDTMYDNAYIAVKGGRWQLYRGGDAISGVYGQLDYVGRGLFSFRKTDGKGWGFVDTSGKQIVEYDSEYERLFEYSLVAIKSVEKDFFVKNGENRTFRAEGKVLKPDAFKPFYDAYGELFVAFVDKDGKYCAVNTSNFKVVELPFKPTQNLSQTSGFVTVIGSTATTYDSELKPVDFLNGVTPDVKNEKYFVVVNSRAVVRSVQTTSTKFTLASGKSFEIPSVAAQIMLTNGKSAVATAGGEYYYFNGVSVERLTSLEELALTGSVAYKFVFDGGCKVFDADCNVVEGKKAEVVSLIKKKEKNRAGYAISVDYLLCDGKLYVHENGKWEPKLSDVISVVSDPLISESRIVTRSKDGTVVYDSFFNQRDKRDRITDGEVIDAFLPAYATTKGSVKTVTCKDGTFEVGSGDTVEILYCANPENYYVAVGKSDGKVAVHSRNGEFIDYISSNGAGDKVFSETQLVSFEKDVINVITRKRKIDVKYTEKVLSEDKSFALAINGNDVTVVNLNDGAITGEYNFFGGIEVAEMGGNTFVIKSPRTGLYGVISGGKLTLSPTFKRAELHDGFIIASVDDGAYSTYFQADFTGKRIGKTYTELLCTEGITIGTDKSGEREVMNSRGRVVLENVTFVPKTGNEFVFMGCRVYDEETRRTVEAERKDNSRLLVVTAGGYKRVVSISRDTW